MSKSLSWRLARVFGLVILLSVALSGTLSIWITSDRFNVLSTDEGKQRAMEIAPLLEANYAYWGNWRGLDELFTGGMTADSIPVDIFVSDWNSALDWGQVSAQVLNIDEELFWDYYENSGYLLDVAESQNIDPNNLVNEIVSAEQKMVDYALANDQLSAPEATEYMAIIQEGAYNFVWGYNPEYNDCVDIAPVSWENVIAEALNIPLEKLLQDIDEGRSIATISSEHGIPPEYLVDILLDAEISTLYQSGCFSEEEIAYYQQEIEYAAWVYIEPEQGNIIPPQLKSDADWTTEGINWLISTFLVGGERLLIADEAGWAVYDSEAEHYGAQLPETMLREGITLWNYESAKPIGTVIIVAGPGYYNAHQASFLRGVSRALGLSGLLSGMIALLIGLILARRITAPVTDLTAAAHRMANGDKSIRLPIRSDDELGKMSHAFNTMAEALEKQEQLRNRLIDDVTHELNTPLSVIQLELEALKDNLQGPEDAAIHVEDEIELLRNLVNDLALLAEAESESFQLNRTPTDLMELTRQAIERWSAQAEASGIRLLLSAEQPLEHVLVDPTRIIQVLGNLIANALKHTPRGGSIRIHCQPDPDPRYVLTSVSDNGTGIPDADLPHIFERFYRADLSRNRHTGGRGLGLAIVKQIIERHHGEIRVKSQAGQGSAFEYRLPIAEQASDNPASSK